MECNECKLSHSRGVLKWSGEDYCKIDFEGYCKERNEFTKNVTFGATDEKSFRVSSRCYCCWQHLSLS